MEALEKAKDLHYFKSRTSGWRWKFFLIGAAYSLIFTTFLTVDYFLTSHHKAVPEVNYFGLLPETVHVEDELFKISSGAFWHNDTRTVQLNYSYFFKDLKSINVLDQYVSFNGQPSDRMFRYRLFSSHKTTEFYSYGSVYYVFPFLHLFLLIPTLVVIFKRPHFYFALGRLVTLWAIFPLLVYLSLSNWRILHLFGLL